MNVTAHNPVIGRMTCRESNLNPEKEESYEERRRKLLAPLPVIHIITPRGNSQAPNSVLEFTHIADGDY